MMETRPYVSWKLIGEFMRAAFEAKGVPVGEAVQKELVAVRDELKLPFTFPFEG